ncbi:Putative nuclease HARBI1 [Linum perenne]
MKGTTTINVLAACNQNRQFIYYFVGWEGSAHESKVLRGKYYLCDAGYTNAKGFLAPYRGHRYHLTEWGGNRPRTAEEYFNRKHSKVRNVIEKAFGVLKMRWAFLRDTSWYSPRMVGFFFCACCLLHNYIRAQGGTDVFEMAYIRPVVDMPTVTETIDEPATFVEPSEEWTRFRHALAQCMWAAR